MPRGRLSLKKVLIKCSWHMHLLRKSYESPHGSRYVSRVLEHHKKSDLRIWPGGFKIFYIPLRHELIMSNCQLLERLFLVFQPSRNTPWLIPSQKLLRVDFQTPMHLPWIKLIKIPKSLAGKPIGRFCCGFSRMSKFECNSKMFKQYRSFSFLVVEFLFYG